MTVIALQSLMETLRCDSAALAARLGGCAENYERLKTRASLPFPVWDALQRLAFREGYAWDAKSGAWKRAPELALSR